MLQKLSDLSQRVWRKPAAAAGRSALVPAVAGVQCVACCVFTNAPKADQADSALA